MLARSCNFTQICLRVVLKDDQQQWQDDKSDSVLEDATLVLLPPGSHFSTAASQPCRLLAGLVFSELVSRPDNTHQTTGIHFHLAEQTTNFAGR